MLKYILPVGKECSEADWSQSIREAPHSYMRTDMETLAHTHTHTHTHAQVHTNVYAHAHTRTHTDAHTQTGIPPPALSDDVTIR